MPNPDHPQLVTPQWVRIWHGEVMRACAPLMPPGAFDVEMSMAILYGAESRN